MRLGIYKMVIDYESLLPEINSYSILAYDTTHPIKVSSLDNLNAKEIQRFRTRGDDECYIQETTRCYFRTGKRVYEVKE